MTVLYRSGVTYGYRCSAPALAQLDGSATASRSRYGGLIGVFFHSPFLWRGTLVRARRENRQAYFTRGSFDWRQHVALGSDWDGMILTPRDMPTCLELPRLVQALLNERLSELKSSSCLVEFFATVAYGTPVVNCALPPSRLTLARLACGPLRQDLFDKL